MVVSGWNQRRSMTAWGRYGRTAAIYGARHCHECWPTRRGGNVWAGITPSLGTSRFFAVAGSAYAIKHNPSSITLAAVILIFCLLFQILFLWTRDWKLDHRFGSQWIILGADSFWNHFVTKLCFYLVPTATNGTEKIQQLISFFRVNLPLPITVPLTGFRVIPISRRATNSALSLVTGVVFSGAVFFIGSGVTLGYPSFVTQSLSFCICCFSRSLVYSFSFPLYRIYGF